MARTLVVHSTEGSSIAGAVAAMDRNRSWSNWVCDPAQGIGIRTLVDDVTEDRSLRNMVGGVETNMRPGVWQLEVVGYAEQIPDYPEDWFRRLGVILSALCDRTGVPRRFPYPFRRYPASYGLRASQRLSPGQWLEVDGIVGHQHVPENDHGDPGDISRVIPYVLASSPPRPVPAVPSPAVALALEYPMPLPTDVKLTWSLLDLDDCIDVVEDLYRVRGNNDIDGISYWHGELATLLEQGKDPRPLLAEIAKQLREAAG